MSWNQRQPSDLRHGALYGDADEPVPKGPCHLSDLIGCIVVLLCLIYSTETCVRQHGAAPRRVRAAQLEGIT